MVTNKVKIAREVRLGQGLELERHESKGIFQTVFDFKDSLRRPVSASHLRSVHHSAMLNQKAKERREQ